MSDPVVNNRKISSAGHGHKTLERRRLSLQAVDPTSAFRLLLVRAPIGFGKTTLLSQWSEEAKGNDHSVGWITLTKEEHCPEKLLEAVFAAFDFVDHSIKSVEILIDLISSYARQYVLFIDDYDEIIKSEGEDLLVYLIETMPQNVQFAIAGYSTGRLPLGHLIRSDEIFIIDRTDISFTPSEQSLILGSYPTAVANIIEACSGWPLALRLLKNISAKIPSKKMSIEYFCLNSGISEIIDEALHRFDPWECEGIAEVLGVTRQVNSNQIKYIFIDSQSVVAFDFLSSLLPIEKENENGLSIYTADIFVHESLKMKYQQMDDEKRIDLLLRMADSFASTNHILEAINFAVIAGHHKKAIALAEEFGPIRLLMTYGVVPIFDLIEQIPTITLSESPRIQLLVAIMYSKRGQLKEAREMVSALLRDKSVLDNSHSSSLLNKEAVFARLNLSAHFDAQWKDKVEKDESITLLSDPLLSGWLRVCSGMVESQLGNLQKAEREFQKSNDVFERLGADYQLLYLKLHAAHILLARGLHKEAAKEFSLVQRRCLSHYSFDRGLLAATKIGLLEAKFHSRPHSLNMGALNAAVIDLMQSEGWFEPFASAYFTGALCAWHTGGIILVQKLLDEAENEFAKQDIHHVRDYIRSLRAFYLLKAGEIKEARHVMQSVAYGADQNALNAQPRIFWRERHISGLIRIMMLHADHEYDQALAVTKQHLDDAEHDERLFSLAEFLMWRAYLSKKLKRNREFKESFTAALTLACRLRLRSPLAGWLEFIESNIDQTSPELSSNVREFVASLNTTISAPQSAEFLLSEREIAILKCVAQGYTNKRIAQEYSISPNTVKYHLKKVFAKLQINDRREAAASARQLDLV